MKRIAITLFAVAGFISAPVFAQDEKKTAAKDAENTETAAAPQLERQPSPKGAKAYIISPKDGRTVKKKFLVRFGLRKMGIAPAGIKFPNTGHHHLIIDGAKYDASKPLPMTDNIKHFGAGQTEAMIELAPGKHTLQLVLGDHLHLPHNPPVVSEIITVTVE